MKIEEIRSYIKKAIFRVTDHAFEEMVSDKFTFADITQGIMKGEIIESYPDAYPLPACLINGKTVEGRPIHICVSLPPLVKIITVYEPSLKKWEEGFKKRR